MSSSSSARTVQVLPEPQRARTHRPVILGLLIGIFAASIVVTMLRSPRGIVVSSDPGYAPVPLPLLLVPAALAITMTFLLTRGRASHEVTVLRRHRVGIEAGGLIALAAGFTLLIPVLPLPEDYVLLKAAMFLVVPLVVLGVLTRRRGAAFRIQRPRADPWIVIWPVLVLGVLASVGPFAAGMPTSWPPPMMLISAATATVITAGIGEEVLYRRLLQTRLEALGGPGVGILAASLLFGLMHASSHGDGPLWETALQAIAVQGTTGIALGVIWSRWRRLWACVLAHVLLNGLVVAVHLLGLLA